LMCLFIFSFMLARYGIRGIFLSRKPWRLILFGGFFVLGLFGGFRGYIISCGLLFVLQFFLEGLHRTKLMAVFLAAGILGALALIPLADHIPYTFQRTISFLPYKVSTAAKLDAQSTWDWRVNMWQAILPQVPNYLLLGKGYVLSQRDFDIMTDAEGRYRNTGLAQNDPMVLSEDFHNGPLSVVIPFGIWGCLGFLWFIIAAARVLYLNYRYSDPALQRVNTFLLAAFVGETLFFIFGFGDLSGDMMKFTGLLGLSVSFNGGVRRPVRVIQPVREPEKSRGFVRLPPAPAPAFQRPLPRFHNRRSSFFGSDVKKPADCLNK